MGGPICNIHVRDALQFAPLDDDGRSVTVAFPNSFEPNDGAACSASVHGMTDDEPDELIEPACRDLVRELLMLDALYNSTQSKMALKQEKLVRQVC